MTSFKHINIDWSTPSSSFIQVDAYTKTPVADLYNIKHNHTSLNVLSTQDILYYDIDIYLKFYKRSLPKEEPLPPQEDFPSPINATHNENAFSSLNAPTTIPRDHNTPKNDLPDTYPSTDVVTPSKKNITSPFPSSTHNVSEINNTPLLVSFKKFHVTHKQRSGYNKIYECRRSRSFFFELVDQIPDTNDIHLRIHTNDYHMLSNPIRYTSTSKLPNAKYQISKGLQHFFSGQRVIPRRIQHKYFNLIRKKLLERIDMIKSRVQKIDQHNRSTKTFFNFSYKRYRFYFGIYVSCDQEIKSDFNQSTCRIPSPIIMSNHRHACGAHFKNIYRDITVASSKEKTTDLPISPANTKITHANLLHARWSSKYTKKVQSNRTGRSYNVSYSARGLNELKVSSYKHIYSKRLTNFQTSLSGHSNVAKKQNERFERSERRRFNQDRLSTSKDLNPSDKARIGRRTRFLFSGIREIKIPIKHLQYKKARKIFWQKDYKFLLPYDGLMPTVEPYNPRPKGFIPMKYRDIIPPDPIYTKNGSFIVPGSREWYTHMYKLEKIVRLTPIWEKEEKERQQLILDHGSSAKHHDLRQDMKMRLTELNDLYHEGLIIYRNDLIENGKSTHPNYYGYVDNLYRTTEDNYKNFMVRYNNKRNCYRDDFKKRLNTKKGRMNDETKRIEHRPNKRDCPSSFSTIDTSSPPLPKKPRCGERPLSILTKSSY
ncbi:hypothetical protein RhiirA4_469669 [Rhizophagus irregularis]|uniref:DUF8211 domain-containing protein n=1 Tax=Rhizophagus irregularis TaxID=588596 RepID=A0A2I1GZX7_9GLOM|nr:hypothetical protein RhiirA4_469669 [Rhizophagus irregularis]